MKKILFRWVKVIILLYCLIGIAFYYLQDYFLFHPEPLPRDYAYSFSSPFKELNVPYNATTNINVIQFTTDSVPKGVVLYFHGNRKNISWYKGYASNFTKNNYEVWMIDYPGYGKSTGDFNEDVLYEWALIFYKLARARFATDSIIIYGKSLGTGIAAELASVRDCKALILETPYYSCPSVISRFLPVYPVSRMVHFKIPTWQYLQEVTAPITIFHGTDDEIINLSNAKRLEPFLKKTDQFITMEGGSHNNLVSFPVYHQKLDSILHR